MALRLIVGMAAAEGKGDEFALAFNTNVPSVRSEAGCEEYALFRSTENPDRFILMERWNSQAHLDAHGALMRSGRSATAGLRSGEPAKVERYEV